MYTPQVSALSRDSLSGRASPRPGGKTKSVKALGALQTSFSVNSPGLHGSRIIEETPEYTLESLGTPLPVLVTEVLASSDRSAEVTVEVSERGWAWLVCGRRLLVWRYHGSDGQRRLPLCRELTLPPSDLAHKAELVQVLGGSEVHVPSCLAVSPEGTLRYWPSIIYESSSTESNADLQGQECERLLSLGEAGCLLATTTSTLVLVSCSAGRLACRRLASPAGLLGGIGRRMSSLIWGAMQASGAEEPLVSLRTAPPQPEDAGHTVYVLTARHLQRWWVDAAGASDHMDSQTDLYRMARESFLQTVWSRETDSAKLDVTLRDLWVTENSILVLITAPNPPPSKTTSFAIGVVEDTADALACQWSRFDVIHRTASAEEAAAELSLLATAERAFVRDRLQILCVNLSVPSEAAESVRLSTADHVLGWGLSSDSAAPLVFTSQHGLLRLCCRAPPAAAAAADISQTVNLSLLGLDQSRSQLSQSMNVSLTQVDPEQLLSSSDEKARLRAACILFCKNDRARCSALVEELFPWQQAAGVDSLLDTTVTGLSQDIIDDYPAADPRWAEVLPHDATVSSTNSVILLHQLNDKREAHQLFIDFLKDVGIWGRLTGVTRDDSVMATAHVLKEHHEKIIAAMALSNLSAQLGQVVDEAVTQVVLERGELPPRPLTAQDVFFRRLSAVDDIISALVCREEELMVSGAEVGDVVQLIADTNTILVRMMSAVSAAGSELDFTPSEDAQFVYQPWSTAGPARPLLLRQYEMTQSQALPATEPGAVRTNLYQQMLELADLILDGYQTQLESLRGSERYEAVQADFEADRYKLIKPLLEAEQYERATSLAEKYLDFRILVQVCERTNNADRRNKYLTQFADKGFASFVFNWYLDQGKRGQLLSQCRRAELATFLHEYRGLRWLNEIEAGQYGQAGETLAQCATTETEFLTRKKTYLSLSKLCALAGRQGADVENHLARLQPALTLTQLQENLPLSVLEAHGLEPETMPVLAARDLVRLYVAPENTAANEFDFERALELAECADLPEPEREELRVEVWARAVARDDWAGLDTDRPLEAARHTLLLRTLEGLALSGRRPAELLPPPERLLQSPLLQTLAADASFRFIMEAVYEHVREAGAGQEPMEA